MHKKNGNSRPIVWFCYLLYKSQIVQKVTNLNRAEILATQDMNRTVRNFVYSSTKYARHHKKCFKHIHGELVE